MSAPTNAATNASKKGTKVTCQTNSGPKTTLYVSSNGNAPAPVVLNAKAAKKTEVDAIIRDIDAAVLATVTNDTIPQFNKLLERYRVAVPSATGVDDISAALTPEGLATAVGKVVAAVKTSAPKAGGGRRKTHRKKHGKHSKTHKKHGKRSMKHHKKHGKTHGKRSKTHKKRHHKKH